MRKGSSKKRKPAFSLPEMTGDLTLAVSRLSENPEECNRVWHTANALGKAVAAIRADLKRLEMMGLTPSPENAAFPYHPEK